MRYLLLSVLITFASCYTDSIRERDVWVCNCEQQKAASQWVKESIEPANNKSDEEMEDVIKQLERTSIRLNCEQRTITVTYGNNYGGSYIKSASLLPDSCRYIYWY